MLTEEAAKTVALSLNKQVRNQTFIYSSFALIFIGLIGLSAYYFWKKPEAETTNVKTIAEIPAHSIAVLPFKNLTADAQDDFLSIGLTDALITKLSGISRLAVRPTTSVMPFTDEQNAAAIGEKLKVENVLEGTIQRSGGRLRISARLVRIADNTVLWSKNFDEDSNDFLDFQDAVSVQIANTLLSTLSRDEQNTLARRDTENTEAFALYLKGQYFLSRRSSKDLPKALEFYEKAKEADRNFSLPYIGIARTYAILGDSGWAILPPDIAFEKARAALQKASEINPNSAESLTTLATIQTNYDWNLPKAEENFRRALEINPNLAAAHHQFGWMKIAEKKYAEADAEFKRALELDPTSPILTTEIGYPAFFAKDYAAAEKYFRKALEFDENSIPAQFNVWRVLHHQAKYAEASDTITKLENLVDKQAALLLVCKARTLHRAGKMSEAEQIYKDLVERKNTGEKISPNFMAILAAELEKEDETFDYLDESIKERNSYILHLDHAPEFENFRNDPRFAEMLAKIKP